jgi:basic amino acid/polyamine antiporter, APA family
MIGRPLTRCPLFIQIWTDPVEDVGVDEAESVRRPPVAPRPAALARRLGFADAVVVGLGAMLGAGVFSVFAPAARAAGAGLLIGLAIAAAVAYCNAVASAQLAAQYPTSGGTYAYGRELLGPWWGFAAGWGFVVGKTASCAAIALTFAAYASPGPWWVRRLVAVAAVAVLSTLNYRGVTKTAAVTRILVALAVTTLTVAVTAIWLTGTAQASHLRGWDGAGTHPVLQSAGLLFFAFAGYARLATLGEEVRDPARTIPRAIPIALLLVLVIYLVVAVSVLAVAGPATIARSAAPISTALTIAGAGRLQVIVRIGAAAAALGALLSLIAGVGRTTLAMSRSGDLPAWLSAVHPRFGVPHRAEVALAGVVCALVLSVDLRGAIGFSSFAVLTYYAIANLCAMRQRASYRRWPRAFNVLGLVGCVTLVASLPYASIAAGGGILAVGLLGRGLVRWWHIRRSAATRTSSTGPSDVINRPGPR